MATALNTEEAEAGNPVVSNHTIPGAWAWLYGGEYETYDSHMHKDPVCAVCRAALPTTVMVPGTNRCEAGWTLQYSGYLMANHWGHVGSTEYICVDTRLESFVHSNVKTLGSLLYFTIAKCGALPCDPYVDSKVVLCAVCSK